MPIPCHTHIEPTYESDPCGGERTNAKCVIDESTYTELGLEANSTQQQINQALYLAFLNLKATVENLQTQIDNLI